MRAGSCLLQAAEADAPDGVSEAAAMLEHTDALPSLEKTVNAFTVFSQVS